MKSVSIKVYGKVQGVGFRFYTQKKARELGIQGFVKNILDGSVYVEAEGTEEKMDKFILWINDGPPWARVDDVRIQDIPQFGAVGFAIR